MGALAPASAQGRHLRHFPAVHPILIKGPLLPPPCCAGRSARQAAGSTRTVGSPRGHLLRTLAAEAAAAQKERSLRTVATEERADVSDVIAAVEDALHTARRIGSITGRSSGMLTARSNGTASAPASRNASPVKMPPPPAGAGSRPGSGSGYAPQAGSPSKAPSPFKLGRAASGRAPGSMGLPRVVLPADENTDKEGRTSAPPSPDKVRSAGLPAAPLAAAENLR